MTARRRTLTQQWAARFQDRNRRAGYHGRLIDYYDSTHTIYVSKLHRDLHFQIIARDIIGYISSPEATVLDYACGEALSASQWHRLAAS